MTKDKNIPAFPQYVISNGGAHVDGGMTLRDYFAAKAMQAIVGHEASDPKGTPLYAENAYKMADAMLKAREV